MTPWPVNIELVQRRWPLLAYRLLSGEKDAEVFLRATKTPQPTLLVKKNKQAYALHHPDDPLAHSKALLDSISNLEAVHHVLLFGSGLGYMAFGLVERHPNFKRLFILEPSFTVFRTALETQSFTSLLEDPRVTFVVGVDQMDVYQALLPHVIPLMANPPLLIDNPPITGTFPEWTAAARQQIQEVIQFGQSGLATKMKDGPLTLANLIRNSQAIQEHPGLREVGKRLAGIPAIIVAAGPSLSKNMHELRDAMEHFMIIATDTAFEPLRRSGVMPHFVVTVDPTELNLKHFAESHYGDAPILLYDPESRPELPLRFNRCMTYMTDKHPFFEWLDTECGGKGILKKGSMVSQAGFYAADALGCDPIILVGQDLALSPEGYSHAHGTALQRTIRFLPDDTRQADIPHAIDPSRYAREPLYWVEGVDGKPVPTLHNLMVYLRMVESDVQQAHARVIDATEGGAKIRGTVIQALRETLERERRETTSVPQRIQSLAALWTNRPPGSGSITMTLKNRIEERERLAEEAEVALSKSAGAPPAVLERELERFRQRLFSNPAAEYLIEYSAPRELFEFLRLPPANASEAEKLAHLHNQFQCLLNTLKTAAQHLNALW